jgi:CheY-like chemotaxis protein
VPGKVLVADDSLKIQKEIAQLLKGTGVEVTAVSNGEHAVRKLVEVNPDLVLADVFMPVRSGYEVCLYIKADPRFAHIPVFLLASKLEPYDEKEAARVCADGKLEKPFSNVAAIRAMLLEQLKRAEARPAEPAPPPAPAKPTARPAPAAAPVPDSPVGSQPEPEPESESFEQYATHPPLVTFEASAPPMSFADMEEPHSSPTAEAKPNSEILPELELETTTAEELPAAEVVSAEPLEKDAEESTVVRPELAEAWEMTGPPPGAPEIPSYPSWDSQWSRGEEEPVGGEEVPVEAPAPVEVETPPPSQEPAAASKPAPAPAQKKPPTQPYPPENFADAFAKAQELAKKTIYSLPASQQLDPQTVEKVVQEVLARLSPQLMDTIARELVRPLAETLLKEKLKP